MTLDIFRLLLIDIGEIASSPADCLKEFVQFGLRRLSIAMLSSLYEHGHRPDHERGNAMHVQAVWLQK